MKKFRITGSSSSFQNLFPSRPGVTRSSQWATSPGHRDEPLLPVTVHYHVIMSVITSSESSCSSSRASFAESSSSARRYLHNNTVAAPVTLKSRPPSYCNRKNTKKSLNLLSSLPSTRVILHGTKVQKESSPGLGDGLANPFYKPAAAIRFDFTTLHIWLVHWQAAAHKPERSFKDQKVFRVTVRIRVTVASPSLHSKIVEQI